MTRWGYPDARGRIAPAPIHPNEATELIEAWRARRFAVSQSVTGAVGENPHLQLFMPAASLYWAIIDAIVLTSSAAQQIIGRYSAVEFGTTLTPGLGYVDAALSSRARAGSFSGVAAAGEAIVSSDILAVSPFTLPDRGLILRPGIGFHLQGGTTATTLRVLWRWREVNPRELELP